MITNTQTHEQPKIAGEGTDIIYSQRFSYPVY